MITYLKYGTLSFGDFLKKFSNDEIRDLCLQIIEDLDYWSTLPDKNRARNTLAAARRSDNDALNAKQNEHSGGLKKFIYKTLISIENQKKIAFDIFICYLKNLQKCRPNKNVISFKDYAEYLNNGPIKGKIKDAVTLEKIKFVFNVALEQGIIINNGRYFKILKKDFSI